MLQRHFPGSETYFPGTRQDLSAMCTCVTILKTLKRNLIAFPRQKNSQRNRSFRTASRTSEEAVHKQDSSLASFVIY